MAVSLLTRNSITQYCEFSYDDWQIDGSKLPTLDASGQDKLSTIKFCCQGSIAIGTDGSLKILTGSNEWIDF